MSINPQPSASQASSADLLYIVNPWETRESYRCNVVAKLADNNLNYSLNSKDENSRWAWVRPKKADLQLIERIKRSAMAIKNKRIGKHSVYHCLCDEGSYYFENQPYAIELIDCLNTLTDPSKSYNKEESADVYNELTTPKSLEMGQGEETVKFLVSDLVKRRLDMLHEALQLTKTDLVQLCLYAALREEDKEYIPIVEEKEALLRRRARRARALVDGLGV